MIIYPAIDLFEGKCVRLHQGRFDLVKVYSDDPSEVALKWQDEGAEILHVVDLEGSLKGKPQSLPALEKILKKIQIPLQFGGGIRNQKTLKELFDLGVSRIILGTTIINSPQFLDEASRQWREKLVASLDIHHGKIATNGWVKESEASLGEIVTKLEDLGIPRLVFTDISKDGTRQGLNIAAIKDLALMTNLSLIASGGVASLEDLKNLKVLEPLGVEGVIIGTALYEGNFSLAEAIKEGRGGEREEGRVKRDKC